jgi:RNA polymerase sigma factor (sigma-70 family)
MAVPPVPVPPPAGVLSDAVRSNIRYKARMLCRSRGFRGADADSEDVEQQLTLGLLAKASRYDPMRSSFATYADRVIDSECKMMLRARRAKKRGNGSAPAPLDDDGGVDKGADVVAAAASRECSCRVASTLATLPPSLTEAARRLTHDPVATVAQDMGLSRQAVYRLMAQLRDRFTDAGLDQL